jgi:hypothetical protein
MARGRKLGYSDVEKLLPNIHGNYSAHVAARKRIGSSSTDYANRVNREFQSQVPTSGGGRTRGGPSNLRSSFNSAAGAVVLADRAKTGGQAALDYAKGVASAHGAVLSALGKTIADAIGEPKWDLFLKVDSKTEVDNGDGALDLGGGGSGTVDHHERGAGSAIAEFRMRQKYLITEGAIRSVPLEFTAVKGAGATGAVLE